MIVLKYIHNIYHLIIQEYLPTFIEKFSNELMIKIFFRRYGAGVFLVVESRGKSTNLLRWPGIAAVYETNS